MLLFSYFLPTCFLFFLSYSRAELYVNTWLCVLYIIICLYIITFFWGCICSSSTAFLLLLLCYSLTLRVLFLSSLCPEVFAISSSIITCKAFTVNILYIYTFNYLYLKPSSFSVFTAASNSSLSPVWFAFDLFTSSLSYSIADETSVTLSMILFLFS